MTAAALVPGSRGDGPTPLTLDGADRLEGLFAPIGGFSRAMLAIVVGSLALHLAVVATAIVTSRAPLAMPEPHETTVEVVQEVPETPKPPPPKVEAPKLASSEPEAPKLEAPKPETPKPAPAKAETPPQAVQPPKPAEASRTEPPKIEAPKPAPTPHALKAETDEREALLKELAALRAQESTLEARPQAPADLGMGPLPDSFQAVALPASTEGAGEAMGYKEIVFSQLAKAKGLDERMGLPGTAGVRFSVDAAGGLVEVEVVHPSGVAALDREAIEIVRRAAPFPAPPAGAQRNFTANVSFVTQGKP